LEREYIEYNESESFLVEGLVKRVENHLEEGVPED